MSKKKIFFIVLGLFILASAGLVVYNLFLKDSGAPNQRNNQANGNSIDLKPKPISQEKAFALTIGQDQQTIKYYTQPNGHVFQSSFDGSGLSEISSVDLKSLKEILWSPDKKKVVSVSGQPAALKKSIFNYQTRRVFPLNENIKSIAWSPDSQKIAYQYQSADGLSSSVSVADPDGSRWRDIFPTRLEDLIVQWPSPDKISIRSVPSSKIAGFLFTIDPDSQNFNKIFSNLYGLSVKWSTGGQKILYQATDDKGKNLKLFVSQADGTQAKELPSATLAEKCVWSGDEQNIFCAVPQRMSENAVWPDDYLAGRVIISDDFYIIDTATQKETKIAQSETEQSFDADQLLLSPNEDYLFFINKKDGLVYSLKLEIK